LGYAKYCESFIIQVVSLFTVQDLQATATYLMANRAQKNSCSMVSGHMQQTAFAMKKIEISPLHQSAE